MTSAALSRSVLPHPKVQTRFYPVFAHSLGQVKSLDTATKMASTSGSSQPWLSMQTIQDESNPDATPKRVIHIRGPTSFFILPPSAALIGLVIGMSRGGSKARLRFLAENAHRPPTTVQGWVSVVSGSIYYIGEFSISVLLWLQRRLAVTFCAPAHIRSSNIQAKIGRPSDRDQPSSLADISTFTPKLETTEYSSRPSVPAQSTPSPSAPQRRPMRC